jgi:aminopeptidase YwaD
MKRIFYCLLFITQFVSAQKLKKADKIIIANLQSHINYLADDKLEGRQTGSNGEKLAYEYISNQFLKAGLLAKGDKGTFLQEFEIKEGKMISSDSYLFINGNELIIGKDYFPLSFSSNSSLTASASIALQENGTPWLYDVKELVEANKNNVHFDLTDAIKIKTTDAAKKGAIAFIIYNTSAIKDELQFDPKSKSDLSAIPVIYITKDAREKYLKDETASLEIKLKTAIVDKKRYGHNVIGYIDNSAANTVIIGAHYDHLGYGEHNSLYTGTTPQIHNGADDNASGTAAVIELSKLLKASKYKNNNYLFICFSGEELGLFGSKYFADHPTFDFSTANYMINLDMVGRLNDSTHGLNIGGYGTSPVWGQTLSARDEFFTIKFDSSGTGPSDNTSFYRKNLPVLFFFTGIHSDYHKPTDDANKINYTGEWMVVKYIYKLIEDTNKKGRLAFAKTRETSMSSKTSFKVTLGIMPDYTFSGVGVRADGISEGRVAEKAGMKAGDVIIQLGDYRVTDIQTYMEALNKFNKGDATKVKVKRGNEELSFDIVF